MTKKTSQLSVVGPSIMGIILANAAVAVHVNSGTVDFRLVWYATLLGLFFGGAAVSLQKLRFKHTNLFAAMRGAMTSYSLVLNVRLNYLYAISGLAMIAAAGRLCHGYEIVSVGYFLASSIYLYPEHQRLIEELSTNEGSMP